GPVGDDQDGVGASIHGLQEPVPEQPDLPAEGGSEDEAKHRWILCPGPSGARRGGRGNRAPCGVGETRYLARRTVRYRVPAGTGTGLRSLQTRGSAASPRDGAHTLSRSDGSMRRLAAAVGISLAVAGPATPALARPSPAPPLVWYRAVAFGGLGNDPRGV